jgi:hypothetical protein
MHNENPAEEYVAVSVGYRFVDGYHVFTSQDARGLYVASRDPRKAYESVAEVLQELMARQNGVSVVEVVPTLTFEEWLSRRRQRKAEPKLSYRPPVLRRRDFVVRLAAA